MRNFASEPRLSGDWPDSTPPGLVPQIFERFLIVETCTTNAVLLATIFISNPNLGPPEISGGKPMTRNDSHTALTELNTAIADLVAKLGLRRTVLALLRGLLSARPRPPDVADSLSTHLRWDIGLNPDTTPEHRDPRLM